MKSVDAFPPQRAIHRSAAAIASILVVKPSSLGDVVHTLPAVALIKRRWPAARLRWLINAEWAPLLDENPSVDELLIFPRREFRGVRGWVKILPWALSLRRAARSDVVLDFQGLLRSALLARLCRRNETIGLSDAREGARFFYDTTVDVSRQAHAVDRYVALAGALDIEEGDVLEWPLPRGTAPAGFSADPAFVLLHPFARGASKSLGAREVRMLCRELAPARAVIVGQSDVVLEPLENVVVLLNRTSLSELIWLIRRATFVVSVDSGPMHIAAALTSRLVAIHTWSDPGKVGPYRADAWVCQGGILSRVADLDRPDQHVPIPDMRALAAFVGTQLVTSQNR